MSKTISSIKQTLDSRVGEAILVIAQAGRKKVIRRRGILTGTFPSIFVVELNQDENSFERVSYSYTDVLTSAIQIDFGDDIMEFDNEIDEETDE